MKKLIVALSSAVIFSMSAAVLADDATVGVIDASITQIQWGHNQQQEAVIGLVADDFKGNAHITILGAHITQRQYNKDNRQVARIGVVGCDCTNLFDEGKGKGKGHYH